MAPAALNPRRFVAHMAVPVVLTPLAKPLTNMRAAETAWAMLSSETTPVL